LSTLRWATNIISLGRSEPLAPGVAGAVSEGIEASSRGNGIAPAQLQVRCAQIIEYPTLLAPARGWRMLDCHPNMVLWAISQRKAKLGCPTVCGIATCLARK